MADLLEALEIAGDDFEEFEFVIEEAALDETDSNDDDERVETEEVNDETKEAALPGLDSELTWDSNSGLGVMSRMVFFNLSLYWK